VFEIGNALREARRRQGLDLAACEQATKIRAKYLMALEEERFEALPEPAYVRGMLRAYADFLDVDSAPVLQEYAHRSGGTTTATPDTVHAAPRRRGRSGGRPVRGRRRRGGVDARLVWLSVGGVGAAAAIIWLGASGGPEPVAPLAPLPTATVAQRPPAVTPPPVTTAPTRRAPPAATASGLRLVGRGGGSWVQVRAGGADGRVLFEGELEAGRSRRFPLGTGLWMRVGWGPGLRATVAGRPATLPSGTGEVVVTRAGVRPAEA